ncbi:MAG: hypothetical protein FH761_07205 [Firmicutes bacterium]|nr:hypothetical protein [Bacillota bacterium]
MDKLDGKIGARELFSIVIIIIGIKGADMTPANLFPSGQSATWMFPIVWLVIMAIPIWATLSLLKKYKEKNIVEIIYLLTGKYIGFIICLSLLALLFTATVLNSRSYVDIMNVMIFPTTPIIVLYAVLIGSSYFIANRGLETIGRTSWLLLPYLVGGIVLLFIILGDNIIIEYLYPITGPGITKVIKSGITHSSLIGEFLLLAIFFPNVRDYKSYKKGTLWGLLLSCLIISLLFIEYILIFDYVAPQMMMHPYSQLTRVTEIGMFITSLDAFFFGLWILTGIIRFSFYLYGGGAILGYTLKIKEYEPLILPITVLTIIVGLIPSNPSQTILILRDNFLIKKTWIYFFALPLVLWIISKFRGEVKK